MLLPWGISVTVDVVNVEGFIASEKVAVVFAVTATPIAPLAGLTVVTLGGVTSSAAVMKLHTLSVANGFPATSVAPLAPPLTVAVYVVLAARSDVGSSVTRLLAAS